jgi:hypothetical protein
MANIQPSLKGWSTTEASNQPDSTDSATIAGDMRAIQAGIRQYFTQDTIASAATTDLGSKEAGTLTISGTTTITALGTVSAGIRKTVVFSGALTLTHNATSLILPGTANITTAANDRAEFESLGSGNWRCNWYTRANGISLNGVQDGDKGDITVSSSGTAWTIDNDVVDAATLADSAQGVSMINGTLTASVASSALTIAIKTKAGTDPSASDPVLVLFRNATAGTGDYTVLSITAATSFVISSGSTLGTSSGVASRLWVVGFSDAGTFRLGAINLSTYASMGDDVLASSTAEGGAGGADSAGVFYTGTAVTSKAMRVLGYVESTQATAGTWATTPSKVQLYNSLFYTQPPRFGFQYGFYESSQQTITSAGSLTLAHGLGAEPLLVTGTLVCQTAEAGFSIGDKLVIGLLTPDNTTNTGAVVVTDATNLNVRFGSGANAFFALNKGTGARASLTNANWKIIFRAWA